MPLAVGACGQRVGVGVRSGRGVGRPDLHRACECNLQIIKRLEELDAQRIGRAVILHLCVSGSKQDQMRSAEIDRSTEATEEIGWRSGGRAPVGEASAGFESYLARAEETELLLHQRAQLLRSSHRVWPPMSRQRAQAH